VTIASKQAFLHAIHFEDYEMTTTVIDFDTTQLPVEMRNFVHALRNTLNVPMEMSIPVALAAINLATSPRFDTDTAGLFGNKPTNLYFMGLSASGSLKTTVFKSALQPFDDYAEQHYDQYVEAVNDYKYLKEAYVSDMKKWAKDPTNNLKPHQPIPPTNPNPVVPKCTQNGLFQELDDRPYVGIMNSEASEFLNGHAFQGRQGDDQRATEFLGALINAWDGNVVEHRTGQAQHILYNRRLNMLLMSQEATARKFLNTPLFEEQGFLPRMLLTQVPDFRRPDTPLVPEVRQRNQDILTAAMAPLQKRIQDIIRIEPTTDIMDARILKPRVMTADAEAATVLIKFDNEMNQSMFDHMRAFAARAGEQAIRIAVTMAAFRMHDVVELEDAELGVELMRWFVRHRQALDIGLNVVNPEITRGAEELKKYMDRLGLDSITSAVLKQKGPKVLRNMNVAQFQQVVGEGKLNGWFTGVNTRSANGREIYEIVRIDGNEAEQQAENLRLIAQDEEEAME
jgi:hypothetical protein